MAAPFYPSTLAPANNTPTEIRKGLFDLLRKLQEISQYLDGFYLDGTLTADEADVQILRAVQVFLNGQDLSLWLNQDVRTTASPTFANVNTPQVTNSGTILAAVHPVAVSQEAGIQFGSSNAQFSGRVLSKINGSGVPSAEFQAPLDNNAVSGVYISTGATPTRKVHVSPAGYTRLGIDAGAPAVKMKKITGTTSNTQGGVVTTAHGLGGKIISATYQVDYTGNGSGMAPDHTSNAGFQFEGYFDETNIAIVNIAGNSANILSKTFVVCLFYEE